MRVAVELWEEVYRLEAEQAVAPAQTVEARVARVLPRLLRPRPHKRAFALKSVAAEARQVHELEAARLRLRLPSDWVTRVHVGADAGLRLVHEELELVGQRGLEEVVEHEVAHGTVQVACAACVFLMVRSICILHAISYI